MSLLNTHPPFHPDTNPHRTYELPNHPHSSTDARPRHLSPPINPQQIFHLFQGSATPAQPPPSLAQSLISTPFNSTASSYISLKAALIIILNSNSSQQIGMNERSIDDEAASSSHSIGEGGLKVEEGQGEECVRYVPKNRQWSEEEHILYLLFLEMNRERIKSKLIRRSNSFYKDMSQFVNSKTPVQCRSHNQKYEDKYKYPHRIIREEKQKVSAQLYSQLQLTSHQLPPPSSRELPAQSDLLPTLPPPPPKQQLSSSCQTDIKGVEVVFLMPRPLPCPQPEQAGPEWYYSQWMAQQQWQYPHMRWFY